MLTMRGLKSYILFFIIGVFGFIIIFSSQVKAATYSSPNFKINGTTGNSFGGTGTSTSYKLFSTGGESIVGNGSSGSYKLGYGYTSTLAQSLQLNVQPSGLIEYYPMDETGGAQAYNNSANTTILQKYNGATSVTGKVGGAVSFDGNNQYADTAVYTDSMLNTPAMTLSTWFKLNADPNCDANNNWRSFARHGPVASNDFGWDVVLEEDRSLFFDIGVGTGSSSRLHSAAGIIPLNTFVHLAFTYNPATHLQVIYLNGTAINTLSTAGLPIASVNNEVFSIAKGYSSGCANGSGFTPGIYDETKLYSRALTASEVTAEYNAGLVGNSAGLSLGAVVGGASNIEPFDTIIQTDASAYNLAINQDHNLQNGATTIPAISGSIASPLTWSEGVTKGLGFSLLATTGTALPAKWNTGASYAALPSSATTFYSRTNKTTTANDVVNMRLRLDVAASQPVGVYSNSVTTTGTIIP
jgi:hypothetical protein